MNWAPIPLTLTPVPLYTLQVIIGPNLTPPPAGVTYSHWVHHSGLRAELKLTVKVGLTIVHYPSLADALSGAYNAIMTMFC